MKTRVFSGVVFTLSSLFFIAIPAAHAVSDPVGDFLASYGGVKAGDLDVTNINFYYTQTDFIFNATLNGNVGTTAGAFYVWGINRGGAAATGPFAAIGAPGVQFDSTVILRPGGQSTANGTNLAASAITINGNQITAIVPQSLLPTTGFQISQYTANLWPRFADPSNPTNPAGNAQISDFAPNNSNITVTAAPEPCSLALIGFSGLGIGVARRRKNKK